jgi:hypothetical protein
LLIAALHDAGTARIGAGAKMEGFGNRLKCGEGAAATRVG